MSTLSAVILIFSIIGAIDYILGNRFGVGQEFEKGFMLLGTMALSMIGMIIIAPFIADIMDSVLVFSANVLKIDPSIIPASLFANDMGGAPLAKEVAKNADIGMFNALVVSSMMGCTVSFTIPVALSMVSKENHKEMLFGLLCGLVTIPFGCFVAGAMCNLPFWLLIYDLLPLVILSGIIAFGLLRFPEFCIKIFKVFGIFIKTLIIIGLSLGIIRFLSGKEIIKGLETIESGAAVCLNASIVMSGAFPLIHVISKLLSKPLNFLGEKAGINNISAMGFLSSVATNVTTLGMMDKMDKKGIVLNSAFAVSASFVFAGHLAFTMAFDSSYVPYMIAGKLIAGVLAVISANLMYKNFYLKKDKENFGKHAYEEKL